MSKQVSIRYIVNDADEAIEFYTKMLYFKVEMHPAAEFAILSRKNLQLLLSKPSGRMEAAKRCQMEPYRLRKLEQI
jgi:catechol 2,3-dioxygenase-like lactoylglutathione lyase family enzyme